ncbi:MAG TPA: outer membrane beta-barrel protein [Spirochaetota bacterium]|nr:outer membrane beta-barrel protein [Spirochaetota bacterium]
MKKVLFAAVAVFVVSGSSALYSQGLEAGSVKFGLYGGGGVNYVSGEAVGSPEAKAAGSYFFGVNGLYNITDTGSLFAGLEYSYRPYKIKSTGLWDYTSTIKAKFIDVNLGYRFTNFQGFYFEGGLFVGVPAGTWKYEGEGDMEGSGNCENKYTKNEIGLMVGAGYLVPIAETADLNIGVVMKKSFTKGYDDDFTKF